MQKIKIILYFLLIYSSVEAQLINGDKTYSGTQTFLKATYFQNDTLYIVGSGDTTQIFSASDTLYYKSTVNFIKFTPALSNLSGGGMDSVIRKTASDSVFYYTAGVKYFAFKDSISSAIECTYTATIGLTASPNLQTIDFIQYNLSSINIGGFASGDFSNLPVLQTAIYDSLVANGVDVSSVSLTLANATFFLSITSTTNEFKLVGFAVGGVGGYVTSFTSPCRNYLFGYGITGPTHENPDIPYNVDTTVLATVAYVDSISGAGTTASNLTTEGAAIYKEKVGNDLHFRTITSDNQDFMRFDSTAESVVASFQYTPTDASYLGQNISDNPTSEQYFPSYRAVVDYVAQADRYAILKIYQGGTSDPEVTLIYSNIDGMTIYSSYYINVGTYQITFNDDYFSTYYESCISSVPFYSGPLNTVCGFVLGSYFHADIYFKIIDYGASAAAVDDSKEYFYIRIDFKTAP